MKRLRSAVANAALLLVTLVLCYLVGGFVFFRLMLPHLPLNFLPHLPPAAQPYMQSSKGDFLPRDYIALLGDSYAQGQGDWLLDTGAQRGLPHHSADVLKDLLGRDVISLGRAASNSAEAMVRNVSAVFARSCYLLPMPERPARFVVYVYEGNDLNDNLHDVDHRLDAGPGALAGRIDRLLDQRYAQVPAWQCLAHFGDVLARLTSFAVRSVILESPLDRPATANRVVAGGVAVDAPVLQVPPLGLAGERLEAALLVYDRALAWLRRSFADVPVTVVYIPAPASIYAHADGEVAGTMTYDGRIAQGAAGGATRRHRAADIYARSHAVCEAIRARTLLRGAAFVDVRAALHAATASGPLHGPRDWNHLNERGYRALAAAVRDGLASDSAGACAPPLAP